MKNKKWLIPVIIIIILFKVFGIYERTLKIIYPTTYSEYVEKNAQKYNIEKEWIYALIKAESNFNKNSISSSGAIGLMQLMENTAIEVSNQVRYRRCKLKKCRNQHRTWNKILYKPNKTI